jgi:hypothetical protein
MVKMLPCVSGCSSCAVEAAVARGFSYEGDVRRCAAARAAVQTQWLTLYGIAVQKRLGSTMIMFGFTQLAVYAYGSL